jgi:hypothetical protein
LSLRYGKAETEKRGMSGISPSFSIVVVKG